MRRQEREITDQDKIKAIIRRHNVLYLALPNSGGAPYVIPMAYGFDGECFYLHCASEGRKLDLLRLNPHVGFAIEAEYTVQPGRMACSWGFSYSSVIGEGIAEIVETAEEKRYGLDVLMSHFTKEKQEYLATAFAQTTVLRLRPTQLSGKSTIPENCSAAIKNK